MAKEKHYTNKLKKTMRKYGIVYNKPKGGGKKVISGSDMYAPIKGKPLANMKDKKATLI